NPVLFSPPSISTPSPAGAFDGQWRYNSTTQALSRWNLAKNEWQAIGISDNYVGASNRSKLLATSVQTGAALITGGGAGLSSVDLNSFTFNAVAPSSLTKVATTAITYIERGRFW